jgi:hypothetical protein
MEEDKTGLYLYESMHHAQDFLKQEASLPEAGVLG